MYNELKNKVTILGNKNLDMTTSIHVNQCNTDKQCLQKKMEMLIKKMSDISGLVTTAILNTKRKL